MAAGPPPSLLSSKLLSIQTTGACMQFNCFQASISFYFDSGERLSGSLLLLLSLKGRGVHGWAKRAK